MVNHAAIVADRVDGLHDRRSVKLNPVACSIRTSTNLADKIVVAFEHDDFVRPCAAHQSGRVRFAWAFAKNFDIASNQAFVGASREIVHDLEQIVIALFFDAFIDLVGHLAAGVSRRGE